MTILGFIIINRNPKQSGKHFITYNKFDLKKSDKRFIAYDREVRYDNARIY